MQNLIRKLIKNPNLAQIKWKCRKVDLILKFSDEEQHDTHSFLQLRF